MTLDFRKKRCLAGLLLVVVVANAPLASAQSFSQPVLVAQGEPGEWHGYRGAQAPRHGYRRGPDGWWYPLAAFMVGAAAGAAMAAPQNADMPPPQPPRDRNPPLNDRADRGPEGEFSPEHYTWCARRYKTYRVSDNSFVPRTGLRAGCISPFGG